MSECGTLQAKPNRRQNDPASLFLLQGPFSMCCWVYAAVPFAVAQGSKASVEPGAQHGPVYPASEAGSLIH